MRITIDNLDGRGPLDYTHAVPAKAKGGSSLTVQRGLNVPSRCTVEMVLGAEGLAVPVRHARVVVTSGSGTTLFTGALATEPVRAYAGETVHGTMYRARVTAVSDEWLLDNLGSGAGTRDATLLGLPGSALLTQLTLRVQAGGGAGLTVTAPSAGVTTGVFAASPSAPWSANARAAAGAGYAAYRALNGEVLFQPVGSVTHALSDADGTLSVAELATGAVRELANDVTLSARRSPLLI